MKHDQFDIIVIGGGHAGCEAAHAAARMGASVALITFRFADLGVMSCNPAIGGLGKGHLVREIDALDGVMGRIADRAGIQFRLLNRAKGPAVQGPRVQADRMIYRSAMQAELGAAENITVIEDEVIGLLSSREGRTTGVDLGSGGTVYAKATILTTGTFLRGLIHVGDEKTPAGRMGDRASNRLADQLADSGLEFGRLKTGTPPRLRRTSIDWASLAEQSGDERPVMFSFMNSTPFAEQISCGITHTNERTHEIIRSNLEKSAMYGGMIDGTGPRYCPSIEDKVVRFSEKTSHQIFLEPEGLTSELVYPNGISTSLPAETQVDYVRSIKGLENAEIDQLGYAIEYDYVDPRGLSSELELRNMPGLYLAGQINGTTGYEEAAAQGLVAGLSAAARALGKESFRFEREDSYIGVMIDDLTTRGVSEPYRMFTSRAEYRLTVRADNADARLTPKGLAIGCVGPERERMFERKMEEIGRCYGVLDDMLISASDLADMGAKLRADGAPKGGRAALSALRDTGVAPGDLHSDLGSFEPETVEQVQRELLYVNYAARQMKDIERLRQGDQVEIPSTFSFVGIGGLSNELLGKLEAIRPETIGQAGRIEGMTPAALVSLLAAVTRDKRRSA